MRWLIVPIPFLTDVCDNDQRRGPTRREACPVSPHTRAAPLETGGGL